MSTHVPSPASAVPSRTLTVCVCAGSCATDSATVAAPPVSPRAYDDPAPTMKRSRRSGVRVEPMTACSDAEPCRLPSHRCQPSGAVGPPNAMIAPIGADDESTHAAPSQRRTRPENQSHQR